MKERNRKEKKREKINDTNARRMKDPKWRSVSFVPD